jgi:hypothetical protein
MLPIRKISETILDFGGSVFQSLPENASKLQLEGSARVVVCAWNAVVLDAWNKTDKFEKTLLSTLTDGPKEMQLIVKRLIKLKKKMFSNDPRAVGHYEIIDRGGEFIFRAEARGDVEHMQAYDVVQ